MKSTDATRVCKICFKEIKDDSLASLLGEYPICDLCFQRMEPKMRSVRLGKWKGYCLYPYNASFRSLIYQFKGCFDYELRDVFLARQKGFFAWRFRNYVIVPAPSHESHNERRGFNHVEEIFEELSLPIENILLKTSDVKQSDLNAKERKEVSKRIAFKDGGNVSGKNVLFVDDILTTGSTAKACMSLLAEHGAKKISFLILAKGELREGPKQKFQKAFANAASLFRSLIERTRKRRRGVIP